MLTSIDEEDELKAAFGELLIGVADGEFDAELAELIDAAYDG